MSTNQTKGKPVRKIAIVIGQPVKANRDRVSGILRRLSQRPDVQTVSIEISDSRKTQPVNVDAVITGPIVFPTHVSLPRGTKHVTFEQTTMLPHAMRRGKACDVYLDNATVSRAAADLLLRRGHVNFAFIGTNLTFERKLSNLRARAFAAYLRGKGFPCQVYRAPDDAESSPFAELELLARFLKELPKPCGVMLYADNRAQITLDACRYAHVSVPDQVALVGVDNAIDVCESLRPTLSSVLPDFEASGYLGADLLLKLLDGEKIDTAPRTYGVKTVVERDSTQDLRCGGLLVTRVDGYLREHFTEKLNIGDLATRFNASRRLMEIRFREIRDCSILERLSALRLAEARHKLASTTIPVAEIATACGYGTVQAFRKAFTSATGLSPRAFRRQSAG